MRGAQVLRRVLSLMVPQFEPHAVIGSLLCHSLWRAAIPASRSSPFLSFPSAYPRLLTPFPFIPLVILECCGPAASLAFAICWMPPPINFLSHSSFLAETYIARPGAALGKAYLLHPARLAQALGCCTSQQLCTSWEGTHMSYGARHGPTLAQESGGGPSGSGICRSVASQRPASAFSWCPLPSSFLGNRPFPGWQLTCLSQCVYLW